MKATLMLTLGLGLLVRPLPAQKGQSPFAKLFAVHFDSMNRDTFVVRWGADKTIGDMLPPDFLLRLPDSTIVRLAKVIVTSLAQVSPKLCAKFGPRNPDFDLDLVGLANHVDSATAVEWVSLMHQMMLTGIYDLPRGHLLPVDSIFPEMQAMVAILPSAERRRVQEANADPHPSSANYCFRAQFVFTSFGAMPPNQAGPLFRAFVNLSIPQ